jgi:hypothetical protein
VGCSSAVEADDGESSSDEGAIVGGDSDTVDQSAVAIVSPNDSGWICSGSVIAPRVVLTAAHCVAGGNRDKTGWRFQVFFGADRKHPKSSDRTIDIVSYQYPDRYRTSVLETSDSSGTAPTSPTTEPTESPTTAAGTDAPDPSGDPSDGDIAVVLLASDSPVPPLAVNLQPIDRRLVGQTVRFVGYGATKSVNDVALDSSKGVRRAGWLKIEGVLDATVVLPANPQNPCHGDSGGPLLLRTTRGPLILGVAHASFGNDCTGGADYNRTDVHAAFLAPYLATTTR